MSETLYATFDGEVLRPEKPVSLEPNTRVRLTIETTETREPNSTSFLKTARKLELEGPADWSARLEEYLYDDPSERGDRTLP
jgi:predicted DNA-binding antitoxin AbrB/MazE fold protein